MTWSIDGGGSRTSSAPVILVRSIPWLRACSRLLQATPPVWPRSMSTPRKTYEGVIRFGQTSDTYDAEGTVTATGCRRPPKMLSAVPSNLSDGHLLQTPPPVSAKKIAGVPAYKLARKKITVDLKPVPVEIKALTAHFVCDSELAITVTCSAGTYIRSLAHDLGSLLGCGALLSALRRTRIGEFSIAEAQTLDELAGLADGGNSSRPSSPLLSCCATFPPSTSTRKPKCISAKAGSSAPRPSSYRLVRQSCARCNRSGELVAIGKLIVPNIYHPSTVFSVE